MKQGKIKGNPISLDIDNLVKSPKNGLGLVLNFTKDQIIETFSDNPVHLFSSNRHLKDGTNKTYYRTDSKELLAPPAPIYDRV